MAERCRRQIQLRQVEANRALYLFNSEISQSDARGKIAALQEQMKSDERIVELRRSVMHAAQSQLRNGVIDTTSLLSKITDTELAENDLATRRIQLTQALYNLNHIRNKSYFLLTCVDFAVILLVAKYALDVPLSGSMAALILTTLVYILLSLALGLFVSTVVDSQMAALLVSGMVFMMPVIMLSGFLFPIENMPLILQWISNIVPARWYIPAMRKIMIEGLGFQYISRELTILTGMFVFLTFVAIKRFKIRL